MGLLQVKLTVKFHGIKLNEINVVKYLGITTDNKITLSHLFFYGGFRLNKANTISPKVRHYLDMKIYNLPIILITKLYSMSASEKMSTADAFFETLFHGPYLKVPTNESSRKDSTWKLIV